MKQITVGLSRPQSGFQPFSWLIRWVQGNTPYSHAYIVIHSDEINRDIVYQASGLKVNCITYDNFKEVELVTDEFIFNVDDSKVALMEQYCVDRLGVPYDVRDIVGIGWVRLMRKFGKTVSNPFADDSKEEYCAKLVEYFLNDMMNENIPLDPNSVEPVDIYNILSTCAGVVHNQYVK